MADYKSSGTDTIVKVVLVFFISLLSFSIGTFVGKKFSDNQHKMIAMEPTKGLKAESAEAINESDANLHNAGKPNASHDIGETISDDQVVALEEEMTSEEDLSSTAAATDAKSEPVKPHSGSTHPAQTAPAKVNPSVKTSETKSTVHSEDSTSNEHAKSETLIEAPKIAKALANEVAVHGNGKYTIQIAAYPTQEEAEKKVSELKSLKFESFSTEATIKGHQWYRVNVGIYATIREAQENKVQLIEHAKIPSAIIQKLNR